MSQFIKKYFTSIKKKITFFDIVIALVIVIIGVVLFFLLFRKKNLVEVIIRVDNVEHWYAFSLHEGQTERDELGRPQVLLKNVQLYSTAPNTRIAFLTLDVQAVYSRSTAQHTYKGQPLVVGMPLRVELDKILLTGIVVEVPGKEKSISEKKEIIVNARILYDNPVYPQVSGVLDYFVDAFKVGDIMKDARGETILTVLEKNVKPSKRYTFDSIGMTYLVDDMLRKDVALKLKISVRQYNREEYFLDAIRVGIGESIPIVFEDITMYPTITKIYRENEDSQ